MTLATYATGPLSHAWWAVVILMLVAGSLYFAFVFSYLYIWTVAPQSWPTVARPLPEATWALGAGVLLVASAASIFVAGKVLARSLAAFSAFVVLAMVALAAALAIEFIGHWHSGLRPDASGYAALVYMASALQLEMVAAIVILGLFVLARCVAGRLDVDRRVTYEALALLTYYAVGQGLLGLLLVHGFPRAVS